jgi:ketosteroid isomerase-like protein
MTDRQAVEQLLNELYAARVEGQLERLCALFSSDARFRIAGTSNGKPIGISARGMADIRPWLTMLLKTFKLSRHEIRSRVIEGASAAVYWRADIHSKITGVMVPTELVDLVEVHAGKIVSYVEFFVPS